MAGLAILQWVNQSVLAKSFLPQYAGVAAAARRASRRRIVTTAGQPVVHAKLQSLADDLGLGQRNQRRMNRQGLPTLHAGLGREIGHPLKGRDELRPAVRVAAIVQRIHSDEDVARSQNLCPGKREGQKDRVARGHIGNGDPAAISSGERPLGTSMSAVSAEPPKARRSIDAVRCSFAPTDAPPLARTPAPTSGAAHTQTRAHRRHTPQPLQSRARSSNRARRSTIQLPSTSDWT